MGRHGDSGQHPHDLDLVTVPGRGRLRLRGSPPSLPGRATDGHPRGGHCLWVQHEKHTRIEWLSDGYRMSCNATILTYRMAMICSIVCTCVATVSQKHNMQRIGCVSDGYRMHVTDTHAAYRMAIGWLSFAHLRTPLRPCKMHSGQMRLGLCDSPCKLRLPECNLAHGRARGGVPAGGGGPPHASLGMQQLTSPRGAPRNPGRRRTAGWPARPPRPSAGWAPLQWHRRRITTCPTSTHHL
jgi:hypothetical protein